MVKDLEGDFIKPIRLSLGKDKNVKEISNSHSYIDRNILFRFLLFGICYPKLQ